MCKFVIFFFLIDKRVRLIRSLIDIQEPVGSNQGLAETFETIYLQTQGDCNKILVLWFPSRPLFSILFNEMVLAFKTSKIQSSFVV